jgi:hypothetical protein
MNATMDFSRGREEFDKFLKMTYLDSKKSAEQVAETNFRGVMRWVYSVTPPMGGKNASVRIGIKTRKDGTATNTYNVDYAKGKMAGQRAIFADVHRAFRSIPNNERQLLKSPAGQAQLLRRYGPTATPALLSESPEAMWKWYQSKQSKDKHYKHKSFRRAFASSVDALYRLVLKSQGVTGAGWVAGSKGIGAGSPPVWITRQATRNNGTFKKQQSDTELIFEALNPSNHPDSSKIQASLNVAFQMQANTMARALAAYLSSKK